MIFCQTKSRNGIKFFYPLIRVGTEFVFVVKIAPDGWIQHHIVMDQTGMFIAEVT